MALQLLKKSKTYSVKHMIHRRLAAWEPARDHKNLHSSELMKDLEFCPREYALLDLTNGKKVGQYVGTAMRITFDHGKDMERRMRNDWLRDAAVGTWRCPLCNHLSKFGKVPVVCANCKADGDLMAYEETRFLSHYSGITGGVDMFVDVGSMKHRLVEIKSVDKDVFKELIAPMAEHRFRTSLYLRLVEEQFTQGAPSPKVQLVAPPKIEPDTINTTTAHLLYVSKAYGTKDTSLSEAGISDAPFSPIKEFIIERDDSLTQTSVNKARALKLFRENHEVGVPCGVCTSGLTKRAQKCPAISSCFSGKYPATITWLENGIPRHPGKKIAT